MIISDVYKRNCNEPVPNCLKRPLVIGDREQIEAVEFMDNQLSKKKEERELIKKGELKKYRVYISIEIDDFEEVWARNKIDAEEEVSENFDTHSLMDNADISYSAVDITNTINPNAKKRS